MPGLPLPQVGGSIDVWGPILNATLADHEASINQLLTLLNAQGQTLTITSGPTVIPNGSSPSITWSTNLPGDTEVALGTSTGTYTYGNSPFIRSENVTAHSWSPDAPLADGTYFAQITTASSTGLSPVVSPEFSFVVSSGVDNIAPALNLVSTATSASSETLQVHASKTCEVTAKIRPHSTGGGGSLPVELTRGTFNHAANVSGAASMSCPIPSGFTGKYAVLVFWTEATTTNFASSLSSTCTTILSGRSTMTTSTGARINVFGRRLDGTEGTAITATPGATTDYGARCYIYDNVDATTPLDGVTPMETDQTTTATTMSSTQATGCTTNALAVCVLSDNPQANATAQSVSVGSPWTLSDQQSGTNRVHGAVATQGMTSGGATGAAPWTFLDTSTAITATFSLRSAGGTGGGSWQTTYDNTDVDFTILYNGLSASTAYDYEVDAVDSTGLTATPLTGTFTTSATGGGGGGGNLNSYLVESNTGVQNVTQSTLDASNLPLGTWNGTTGGRSSDLILVAPGWSEGMAPTCTITGRVKLNQLNRIIFKGFQFLSSIDIGNLGGTHYQCDRIGLYFCDFKNVNDPTIAIASGASTDTTMGVSVNGSTNVWLWGCTGHECADDLMHVNIGGDLSLFGIRGYKGCNNNNVHNDFCQVMHGSVYADGCVSGVPPGVHPGTFPTYVDWSNGGHGGSNTLPCSSIQGYSGAGFQIKNDSGPVTATIKNYWNVNSNRCAVTVDGTGSGGGAVHADVQNVMSWSLSGTQTQKTINQYPNCSVTQSNISFNVVPSTSTTPPDLALLNANPTWTAAKSYITAATGITFS